MSAMERHDARLVNLYMFVEVNGRATSLTSARWRSFGWHPVTSTEAAAVALADNPKMAIVGMLAGKNGR